MIKAALHVHSTYSDGEFTLAELREKYLRAGCSLVAMSDHADAFDAGTLRAYIAECEKLSDARLTFLAGLEFGCVQRIHILGYGVTELIASDDPVTVIAHIHDHGGVAVVAHPPTALFGFLQVPVRSADGVEVWNSKYDSRYAPRPETFDYVRRQQRSDLRPFAFYGQDLHWRKQFAELFTLLDAGDTSRASALAALRNGRFTGVTGEISLGSDGLLPPGLRERFAVVNARSQRMRGFIKAVRRVLGASFKLLPKSVKAEIRRFF
jgi:hypothetical protein